MEVHLEIQRLLSQSSAQLRDLKTVLATLDKQTLRRGESSQFHNQRTTVKAQIQLEEETLASIFEQNRKIQLAVDEAKRLTELCLPQTAPIRVLPKSPLPLLQNPASFLRKAVQWNEVCLGMKLGVQSGGVKIVFLLSEMTEVWAVLQEKAGVYRLAHSCPELRDVDPIVDRLNCTHDLAEFVKSLRRAFQVCLASSSM